MFGRGSAIISIGEIHRIYPNQWVAVSVAETDVDGFAVAGEVLVHNQDEKYVWAAVKLGENDDPIYVFHTGSRIRLQAVA
ncbi:MAG TPA: hypothetical protein VLD57_08125 [Blastocatellia bacterium]|nr:hypothetical protein [Blastocatellia bacterium]